MRSVLGVISDIFKGGSPRELEGHVLNKVISSFAVAIALYHLYALGIWRAHPTEVHTFIHLASFLALVFLTYSYSAKRSTRLPVVDLVLFLLVLAVTTYFALRLNEKLMYGAVLPPMSNLDFVAGILLLLLMFEGARRVAGLIFVIVILCFILVTAVGSYLPGGWSFPSWSLSQIVDAVVWSPVDGIWGIPLRISATLVISFFIFGKFMQHSGIADLFISLCKAIAGGARGGPAKIAVVGSGLIGSITAGPTTNIVTVGAVTIPMMKQIGYKPYYAGGIECAASAAASIDPPVMAAAAFLMASLTGIPYAQIMVAAFLPSMLYYLGVLLQVHFQAVRQGIGGAAERLPISQVPGLLKEQGHLLLPIVVLVWLLLIGYDPVMAAFWSTLSVVLAAALRKKTRMGPKKIFTALNEASRQIILIVLTLGLTGIIIVAFFATGLSGMFSHTVSAASGGSLLVLALMAALACLIVGMPAPITAAYLIVVLIVVPGMVSAGLPVLAAHFFCLYYANVAIITPPVAEAAFIAAGIAGASFWRIGFTATRLAIAAFVVPFIFIYRPGLLMIGSPAEIILALFVGVVVIASLAVAFEGWLLRRLSVLERILLIIAAVALVSPTLWVDIGALVLVALVLLWQVKEKIASRLRELTTHNKQSSNS